MTPLTRWFASPVAGTVGVLAALGLLANPLRQVTSADEHSPTQAEPAAATDSTGATALSEIHAILRLRLLAPARQVTVRNTDAKILIESRDMAAGESEYDVMVPLADGGVDLTLRADFGSGGQATAVFLTVMPDGYDDQTRYAIGTGLIDEWLRYEWRKP